MLIGFVKKFNWDRVVFIITLLTQGYYEIIPFFACFLNGHKPNFTTLLLENNRLYSEIIFLVAFFVRMTMISTFFQLGSERAKMFTHGHKYLIRGMSLLV